jgi:hypothetical protein
VLTIADVRAAKPKEKPYKLSDGRGLYLEVRPTGARWWRLKYRHAGKERRTSLGVFPEVSIAEARARRDEARALVRDGLDPSAERQAEKPGHRAESDDGILDGMSSRVLRVKPATMRAPAA